MKMRGLALGAVLPKKRMAGKGFVLTFSAMLIVSLLVLFAIFYLDKSREQEQSILSGTAALKAGFLADDIEADLNKLLGAGIGINRGESFAEITITEKLGSGKNKLALNDLDLFLEGGYASANNAAIQLDVSELVDGKTELKFSNGLQYDYSYGGDNMAQLYVPGGNTGIITIDLNVIVDSNTVSTTPWAWQDITGDINVNLHYVDRNSSNAVTHYGKLDSSVNNDYTFSFSEEAGDTFIINIGDIDGNLKAVRLSESIDDSEAQADVWLKVLISAPAEELSAYWNADLNFSQADVNVNRKLGLWRN